MAWILRRAKSEGRIARTRSGPPETATIIYTPTTTHHNGLAGKTIQRSETAAMGEMCG
nr:ethylene-responsive transcription factor ABR1-like [Ipomoea batatas]